MRSRTSRRCPSTAFPVLHCQSSSYFLPSFARPSILTVHVAFLYLSGYRHNVQVDPHSFGLSSFCIAYQRRNVMSDEDTVLFQMGVEGVTGELCLIPGNGLPLVSVYVRCDCGFLALVRLVFTGHSFLPQFE